MESHEIGCRKSTLKFAVRMVHIVSDTEQNFPFGLEAISNGSYIFDCAVATTKWLENQ
jgi:hypothetical protein